MNVLLEEPTVVVGVGDSVRSDAVRETLLEGAATEFVTVDSKADVLAEIDARNDIGCLVTDRTLPESTGVDLCRDVRARDEALPVVFYVDSATDEGDTDGVADTDGHGDTSRRALNAGATGYYTTSDPLEELRRAVDDAIETYDRRRETAEESEIFTAMLEDLGISIYAKDQEARYLRVAGGPANIDPVDAIGKIDPEVIVTNPEMARETYEDDLRVIETGEPIRDQDEQYGEGRTAFTMRTTKVPWTDDGTTKGLLGITYDVTEFKRKERELDILRDQFEKFSTNLRHDLKNPLQVAIGHLELGRKTDNEESLDHAMDALERIEEIITDLESVAKDESSEPDRGTNSLADLIRAVWNVLHTDAATLENEVPESARTYVAKQTMRPIFENLFKNAVEHGSASPVSRTQQDDGRPASSSEPSVADAPEDAVTHGGDDVTVRVGILDDGFYVEDTGPGIPESERETVLEAGYTTSSGGSGMGLSIVADVCVQQGWDLAIEESPEGGARFEIRNCPLVPDPTTDDRSDIGPDTDAPLELTETTTVGTLEAGGDADYEPQTDRWTISADGHNIWRHWNDFYFAYRTVDAPVRIQGRVTDIEDVDAFSKAGLMIRDDLTEDSTYGFVGATPEFGTELLWRTERGTDGISQQLREQTRSDWFRVDLFEDRVTCFVSRDGYQWTPVDQRPIEYTDPVHVGLVVCSVVSGRPCEATFENVSVFELERADDD